MGGERRFEEIVLLVEIQDFLGELLDLVQRLLLEGRQLRTAPAKKKRGKRAWLNDRAVAVACLGTANVKPYQLLV